jgi:hypothetical protein
MEFKKFTEYLSEKKKPNPKDIEEVVPEKPNAGTPSISIKDKIINATEDYYNAKTPQWNPKGKSIKPKDKKMEEEE